MNNDLLDKLLCELLGTRIGNTYSRGLSLGRQATLRDLIDRIKQDGIFQLPNDMTPNLCFRGEGKLARQKLGQLLDEVGFKWKDYVYPYHLATQPTPQQLRMKIDSRIKELIALLQKYQEIRTI